MLKDLAEGFLLGADPFRIEALWSEMYAHTFWAKGGGPIVFAGISAIEQALWDIEGKHLGVPVYELLGGRVHEHIRAYANGWSFRAVTPNDFAREARRVVDDGYTALKLYPLATAELDAHGHIRHVSYRSIDRAAERRAVDRVRAVREAVGPDVDVMVDMSAELTTDAIIRLGRQLERFEPLFFEEPVDPFDVEALKKVSEQVHLPIAVGERLYTRYAFRRVLELHAADILQPDVTNTGGDSGDEEDRGDGRGLQRAHRAAQLRESGLDRRRDPGRRLHAERAKPGAVPVPDPGALRDRRLRARAGGARRAAPGAHAPGPGRDARGGEGPSVRVGGVPVVVNGPGRSYTLTVTKSGAYEHTCSIHPFMHAKVIVTEQP